MPSAATCCAAAALLFAAACSTAAAQEQAQPAPPPKPYRQLSVTLPKPVADPAFDALRRRLGEIAQRKDRAALSALIVRRGFFWERESGNAADGSKSGLENFAAVAGLDAPDGSGWDFLADYAAEPSASQVGDRQDLICAPAHPAFDEMELIELIRSTESNPMEWGYPTRDGVVLRENGKPDSKVVGNLGLHFVRVVFDDAPPPDAGETLLRVLLPSGQFGFVAPDDLSPIGVDQLCYLNQDGAWKIAGFIGDGAN